MSDGDGVADAAVAADAEESDGADWTPAALADLRTNDAQRRAALVAAALVGVLAASVHWLGLVVAGALVGLVSEDLPRALAAGLAVGVLVLVVHVGASPVMGPGEFVGLAPASYVGVGAALVAPLWGSLVRGVV
jgi:hypothetical protein